MNRNEHILTVVAEEGAELSKEISKALRFGLTDVYSRIVEGELEDPRTVKEKIRDEFIDLLGAYQKAVEEGLLLGVGLSELPKSVLDRIYVKGDKIEAYMQYSVTRGTLV